MQIPIISENKKCMLFAGTLLTLNIWTDKHAQIKVNIYRINDADKLHF